MKKKSIKNICCNCGNKKILNSRNLCKKCSKMETPPNEKKKWDVNLEKYIFHKVVNLKTQIYPNYCMKCGYDFKNLQKCLNINEPHNDDIGYICCSCCKEKHKKRCSKELRLGRKNISNILSSKTFQVDLNEFSIFDKVKDEKKEFELEEFLLKM